MIIEAAYSEARCTVDPCHPRNDLEQSRWHVVSTKGRHEKLVTRELAKKGIETFLPVRKVERNWSDRKKTIEEPLFSGYVFVRMPWADRWQVLNTAGVARFIGMHQGVAAEIPEREIEAVRQFLHEKIRIDPFPYLKTGMRVCVKSGPLKGAEGFVVQKNNRCRLVISLDLLMQSISAEIDEACVEVV